MSDELAALIAAYRAENSGTSLDSRAVRARVLEATWRRRSRRVRRAAWLLPIAAVLVGSGAFAASAPARAIASRAFAALGWFAPASAVSAPARRAVSRSASAPAAGAVVSPAASGRVSSVASMAAEPSVSSQTALTSVPLSGVVVEPRAARGARNDATAAVQTLVSPAPASAGSGDVPSSAPTAQRDEEPSASATASARSTDSTLAADMASYRAAHESHFVRADYARALAAWDSYLMHFPSGTFAPEARLNRAVCLARLGRAAEARAALAGLAESDDAYTRARARGLRAALGDGGSPR